MKVQVPIQPFPDVDIVRIVEPSRHHTGDDVRTTVELEDLSDHRAIGPVARPPESIADDDHRILRHEERPADREAFTELRPDAKDVEQVAADLDRIHAYRVESRIDEIEARPPPRRRALELGELEVVHEIHWGNRLMIESPPSV